MNPPGFNAAIKAPVTGRLRPGPRLDVGCCRATVPCPVPAHAALWSLFRLGSRRSPVGDPRQHKKADPKDNHDPGRRAPPVRWRLGDSSGEVPERVSGAEHAYQYEGQAADQQHPRAHSSILPIDIHHMTLCGEGPVVSRRDSVAISLSCE